MSLTFTIGSSTAAFERSNYYDTGYDEHGDWPVEMDTAAVIVNGRTYAPIRYLAEAFDYGVDWDAESKPFRCSTTHTDIRTAPRCPMWWESASRPAKTIPS